MNSVKTQELVVLLDDAGRSIGTAPKSEVHHGSTPLHLAFSCYLFDDAGRVLLTRRALDKRAFPGIWTNSFCGHPAPDESMDDAVARRAREELGVDSRGIASACCPNFATTRSMPTVSRRTRYCPVFCARAVGVRDRRPKPRSWTPHGWRGISCVRPRNFRGLSAPGPSSRSRCSIAPASGGVIRTSARKDARRRRGRHATSRSPRSHQRSDHWGDEQRLPEVAPIGVRDDGFHNGRARQAVPARYPAA